MKNLISDLNFASKLEHTLQPAHTEPLNAVAVVRQAVTDFINSDIQNQYPVRWQTDESLVSCRIRGDEALIKRAVMNLLQNAQRHNPKGCTLFIRVEQKEQNCLIRIDDDGKGMNDAQLEKTKNAPHYMLCDKNAPEQQHGLGLLIVKQIAAAHMGTVEFAHSPHGGFSVTLSIPAG
jgi:signal transduction histidine kinase